MFCARSRPANKGQPWCFPLLCSGVISRMRTAFAWMHCLLLPLPCLSPDPLVVAWEEIAAQPPPSPVQAFSTFPASSPQPEEEKHYGEITCSSHLQSGPSSPKSENLKSFHLLLELFAHILYSFRYTNKPRRNHFNGTWTIIFTITSKYSSGEKQAEEEK